MSKYLYAIVLLLGIIPQLAQAKCNRDNSDDHPTISTISLPSQILVSSKNYSGGEILYDSGYISGNDGELTIKNCSNNYYVGFHYNMTHLAGVSPVLDGVFPTSLPGIGIRTYTLNQAGPYDMERIIDNSWQQGDGESDHTLNNSSYRVQLVATGGPITSGSITDIGKLATVEFREGQSSSNDGDNASELFLTATDVQVIAMGCSASVSEVNFAMGDIDVSAFNSSPVVEGPPQNVSLSCVAGTNVTLGLTGVNAVTEGDSQDGTVIALTNDGSGTTATGVGVQLSVSTSALPRTYLKPNNTITLFQSSRVSAADWSDGADAAGQSISDQGSASSFTDSANPGGASESEAITFYANYYKTAATITPGSANAVGMLTLQYN
ncbi:type 1 fimbrial protein [Scandinavium sp. M-37]|uniref:type 1 fimbrial protein n=1 Tax=Scandinavium sp. M-37 TaxID=3373077 RepID=UPI003746475E